METLLNTLSIVCAVFAFASELATRITYGRVMKNQEVLDYLKKYESYSINPFDHSILSGDLDYSNTEEVRKKLMEGDYIAPTRMSVISKYYIQGYGRVGYWSKGAKMIDNLYKTATIR